MSEYFSIDDLKSGNRLEQWAAIEIERLQKTLSRANRIAGKADRMFDAIDNLRYDAGEELMPELITLCKNCAYEYDAEMSDPAAESTDTPAVCRRCQGEINEGHSRD